MNFVFRMEVNSEDPQLYSQLRHTKTQLWRVVLKSKFVMAWDCLRVSKLCETDIQNRQGEHSDYKDKDRNLNYFHFVILCDHLEILHLKLRQ